MVRLNDLQFASLLDEIAHAADMDLPLPETLDRLRGPRMGRVGKAAGEISDRLKAGGSLSDAIAMIDSEMVEPVRAAISVCEANSSANQNGSLDFRLLHRISAHLRRRSDLSRVTQLAWAYPIILLVTAYAVLVFVVGPLVRDSLDSDVIWAPWLNGMADFLHVHSWWPPIVVFVLLFLLVKWLRSGGFVSTPARTSLFCASLADQLESGVPESDAINASAAIARQEDWINGDEPKLSDGRIATLVRQAIGVGSEAFPTDSNETVITGLRVLSMQYDEASHVRGRWATIVIPQAVTLSLGFAFIFAYAYTVLRPIYQELARW